MLAADPVMAERVGDYLNRAYVAARELIRVTNAHRKREELRHPFLDETMPMGLVAATQAQLLARLLRGDLDGYPAFFWK